ncbi:MAG TPA: VOC family protein [Herbaspirillum sp.]|jgi:predicted enzyme related to lactoylglutathione lyase
MFAKLNHLAIISENYARSSKFYESIFDMKTSPKARPARATTVGDGYLGLNINPRYAGRPAHFDHFGIQVEDSETAFARMRKLNSRLEWIKRPSNRPFAGITAHDMDGNVFDISQKNMENRRDMYEENVAVADTHVDYFAFRTMNPDDMAEFYSSVFELQVREKKAGDPNHYLTDGHITMVIMPWHITDYLGTGIVGPAMDHIGFKVRSMADFQANAAKVFSENPLLAPLPLGAADEGQARLKLLRETCALYGEHLTDADGILLSVREG